MPAIRKKKEIGARFNVLGYKEEDRHIAHCLEIDLVAEGKTPEEARDNLADLIFSYLRFGVERDIEQFIPHPAPKIYWDKFKEIQRKKTLKAHPIDPSLLKTPRNRIIDLMREVKAEKAPSHVQSFPG